MYHIVLHDQMVGGYADLMQQFGLADNMQAVYVKEQTDAAEAEIKAGNYATAFQVCTIFLHYEVTHVK